jgi:hypothetical protein
MTQFVTFTDRTPTFAAVGGERASYRFFEFFTAQIRNAHTARLNGGTTFEGLRFGAL